MHAIKFAVNSMRSCRAFFGSAVFWVRGNIETGYTLIRLRTTSERSIRTKQLGWEQLKRGHQSRTVRRPWKKITRGYW